MSQEEHTRRRYLELLGVAGGGFLAGCGGDGDDGSPEPQATPTPRVETVLETRTVEGDVETVVETRTVKVTEEETETTEPDMSVDKTLRVPINIRRDVGSYHFNPFGTVTQSGGRTMLPNGTDHYLFYGTLARYNVNRGEYVMDIADSLSVDGTTLQITLSDEYTYHNGDDVTAEDLATSYKIGNMKVTIEDDEGEEQPIRPRQGWPTGFMESNESIQAVDDRTVEIGLTRELSESIARSAFLIRDPVPFPAAVYGQFVEQWNDASTTEEKRRVIQEEIQGFRWKEDAYGAGLWAFEEEVNDGFIFTLHEDHPSAGQINFDRLKLVATNRDTKFPAIGGNEIDCASNLGTGRVQNLPTDWQVTTTPSMGGWATMLSHNSDIFGDRLVRKALAHIIDSQKMVDAISPDINAPVPGTYNGTTGGVHDRLAEEINFPNYESDNGDEKATSLLEDAGFARNGGTWVRPNGEEWTPTVSALADWSSRGRAVVGQLNNFGINAELNAISDNYFGKYANNDFEIAQDFWGSNDVPFPFQSFQRDTSGFPATSAAHKTTYELPPVGEPNGEPTETFDFTSLLGDLSTASSEDAYNEALRKLAWARSEAVMSIPNTVRLNTGFYGQERFSWAEPDNDVYGFNIGGTYVVSSMKAGTVQARQG